VWFDVRHGGAPTDVDLVIGRGDAAVETWRIDAAAPGRRSHDLFLPRAVRSVALRGTPDARERVRRITLEPLAVAPGEESRGGRITAARRYGPTVVMAAGDDAYLEGPGLWTAAMRTAEMVMVTPAGQTEQRVRVRAGPVVTGVELAAGEWRWNVTLQPGTVGEAIVPLAGAATTLRVRTSAGFRPAQTDPASSDTRFLGAWVEFF
jgi:hypothetical protein